MSQTPTLELIESWAANNPDPSLDAWICRARRGIDWPGAWNSALGPRPDDWIKETCRRDTCRWCAK